VTAAALVCAACGAELRENNKVCHQCGARITLSPEPAEYKQVTVLFADAVRSMDIAAAVDMERLREIMTELVERSAAVLRRYGGTVEYTRDGVMALFDHPARNSCLPASAASPRRGAVLGCQVVSLLLDRQGGHTYPEGVIAQLLSGRWGSGAQRSQDR
jgi:DNA-directed RNA polymerase subunit RPC12/RpoP